MSIILTNYYYKKQHISKWSIKEAIIQHFTINAHWQGEWHIDASFLKSGL